MVSLSSNSSSDSRGREEEERLSHSPLGFASAPLAVWFLLSTCLANWKLLNSVTCQNIDAHCSLKKRACAKEVNAACSILHRARSQTPCHTPSIPAKSLKPNCGGTETGGRLGLACFQPSGDVKPGLRKKPCPQDSADRQRELLLALLRICEGPGEPRVHTRGLRKAGGKAHGSVTPQEQSLLPPSDVSLCSCVNKRSVRFFSLEAQSRVRTPKLSNLGL